jgi:ATP-dependent helicase/nuclease subunit A
MAEFVERRLVAPAQAAAVDLASIEWLMQSEAGKLLRAHAGELRRELPVFVAERPIESPDPLDQVMHRGRIDVLIPLADGGVVIDYKTDRVADDEVPRRSLVYAPQVAGYRRAVEAITGKPVRQVLLVFLHARVVHVL